MKFRTRSVAIAATASLLVACASDDAGTGPGSTQRSVPGLPSYQIATAMGGRLERGTEDDILRLEHYLPGLGGVYIDGDTMVIYAPPETPKGQALASLARGAATLDLDERSRDHLVLGRRIKFRSSQYSFSQLVAWSEAVGGRLFGVQGVVGIDANEGTNRLRVLVLNLGVQQTLLTLLRSAGIPEVAVELKVVSGAASLASLRDTVRPTGGGMQVTRSATSNCTLGYNVIKGDVKGFYTAGHCSARRGEGTLGTVFYQSTLGLTNRIGAVTINPPWNETDSNCSSITVCTQVDAIFVAYDSAAHWSSRVAQMTGLAAYSESELAIGDRAGWWTNVNTGVVSYWQGLSVDKVGRTTGWSRGTLEETCVHITVNPNTQSAYRVLCADKVEGAGAISGQGDSGAPVFVSNNDTTTQLNALGILFAGDFTGGDNIDGEGNYYCNTSSCGFYYSRMSRLALYLMPPPF